MPRGEHFVEFIFLELVGLLESILKLLEIISFQEVDYSIYIYL